MPGCTPPEDDCVAERLRPRAAAVQFSYITCSVSLPCGKLSCRIPPAEPGEDIRGAGGGEQAGICGPGHLAAEGRLCGGRPGPQGTPSHQGSADVELRAWLRICAAIAPRRVPKLPHTSVHCDVVNSPRHGFAVGKFISAELMVFIMAHEWEYRMSPICIVHLHWAFREALLYAAVCAAVPPVGIRRTVQRGRWGTLGFVRALTTACTLSHSVSYYA